LYRAADDARPILTNQSRVGEDPFDVSLQTCVIDDLNTFLLNGRGFHWIHEVPFNR